MSDECKYFVQSAILVMRECKAIISLL